jgi:hypothetical protein
MRDLSSVQTAASWSRNRFSIKASAQGSPHGSTAEGKVIHTCAQILRDPNAMDDYLEREKQED